MPAFKKILLLLFTTLFFQYAYSQLDSIQLRKEILDSLCNCISKIDTINFKSTQEVEDEVAACYTGYDKELLLLYVAGTGKKLPKDSEAKFKKFVSSLGEEVYNNCKSMRAINGYLRSRLSGKKEF